MFCFPLAFLNTFHNTLLQRVTKYDIPISGSVELAEPETNISKNKLDYTHGVFYAP